MRTCASRMGGRWPMRGAQVRISRRLSFFFEVLEIFAVRSFYARFAEIGEGLLTKLS
jgi:hypothetical protein